MKISLSKFFFIGIVIQILSTQGIIFFNLFKFFGAWELKVIVHPFGLFITLFSFGLIVLFRGKIKMSSIDALFFIFLVGYSILLFFNSRGLQSFYLGFRELFLVFILVFIYNHTVLSRRQWKIILKLIYFLVLLNIFFVLLTFVIGPEKYMKLLTGTFVWGNDELYNFKISNFYSFFWRSPGLIGESASVGYFGAISYFLFSLNTKYKKKKIYPLILVVISFTRSVYLVLIVFMLIDFLLRKRTIDQLKKWISYLPYIPILLILILWPLYNANLLSSQSFFMRIDIWLNTIIAGYNMIYGGAIGKVGGAVRGEGDMATLDSYWLLMLMSVGLIGIFLIVVFFYEKSMKNQKIKIILISFFFTCFFVTITQSMSFLVLFPLLFFKNTYICDDKNF